MKEQIYVDSRLYDHSGIGVYIQNLFPIIITSFDNVCLLHASVYNQKKIKRVKYISYKANLYSIKELTTTPKYTFNTTLFWSPHYNVPIIRFSGKGLVTIHDVYHLAYYNTLTLKQKIYAKVMMAAAVKLSNAIITVSHFSKAEIIKYTGCDSGKITVIHNGSRQAPTYKPVDEVISKYQLPENYILFVGNVKPHKNLKVLIQAYQLLNGETRAKYCLVIVGKKDGFITNDDDVMNRIINDPHLSKSVHFTGFVDDEDLDTIYKNASLFVFPSYYEGFGLPPLEAMLNECPVISSNAASMPEVCGDAAVYFNPDDGHELAEKINDVLNNEELKIEMIDKGKERVKMFTWENSAEKHIQVINSLLQ